MTTASLKQPRPRNTLLLCAEQSRRQLKTIAYQEPLHKMVLSKLIKTVLTQKRSRGSLYLWILIMMWKLEMTTLRTGHASGPHIDSLPYETMGG